MIRTLIADDEPLAREGLRSRLELERDIAVVGEAEDGQAAVEAILRLQPDLVFLDIQMPGLDGFEVLKRVASALPPVIVFVTAYDRYALRAFEAHALDYLLKPFNAARFLDVLRRARRELDRGDLQDRHRRILQLVRDNPGGRTPGEAAARPPVRGGLARLPVKDGERFLLLDAGEIEFLEAAGNYVRVAARGKRFQLRTTLRELEQQLDGDAFVRIHRSTLVNVSHIREIVPEWHGDYDVILADGTRLRMSRTYRPNLLP